MTYAKGIWIPPTAGERELGCHLCKRTWPFSHRASFEAHFARCIDAHRDEIAEAAEPVIPIADPEIAAHMEKVGDRMIREGRLTMKRNEAAGG